MHRKTIAKVEHLQKYLRRQAERLRKADPDNIVGFHIHRKRKAGRATRSISVVFKVRRKDKEVSPDRMIPRYLVVRAPHRGTWRVPTDVIETGNASLCSSPGSEVRMSTSPEHGTIGFVGSKEGNWYVVSNMHVLGYLYLGEGQDDVTVPRAKQRPNIEDEDGHIIGCFEQGKFSKMIDAAIARVIDTQSVSRSIPGYGQPTAICTPDTDTIHEQGYGVTMYGSNSGSKAGRIVADNASNVFPSPLAGQKEIQMFELLQISPSICDQGDSGALIFEKRNKEIAAIGIVVGKDDRFCYAIPIEKILSKFQLNLV